MKSNHLKFAAVIGFVVLLFVILGFEPTRHFTVESAQKDAATVYKSKCAACHKAKAEKSFDSSKSDDQLVQVVLKGKKDAKPPMPGFEAKGINAAQAKALVAHMRKLRTSGRSNTNTE